tara:strand:+ start:54 stop:362 length:309 start_codon:yes stop_codon:yes gene_type:complete
MTETPTTTKPLTYGTASKIATPVNTDELRDLIAQDDNPDIFSGKGKVRRVGWNLRISTLGGYPYIGWDCDYGDGLDTAIPSSYDGPIFNFERLGRIVRWEAK